jgi:hypothetical protein
MQLYQLAAACRCTRRLMHAGVSDGCCMRLYQTAAACSCTRRLMHAVVSDDC